MSIETEQPVVIACDLSAIPPEERAQHAADAEKLFANIQEVVELENGYALLLPSTSANLIKTAEFIANERLCCPFFTFGLEVTANSGPLWLKLSGPDGVKQFIEAEILTGRLPKPDNQIH